MKAASGFTLVELLTVMLVIVIIMTASIAGWMSIQRGSEMRSSISKIRATLSLARQNAILKNNPTIVCFTNERTFYVSNENASLIKGDISLAEGVSNVAHGLVIFEPQGNLRPGSLNKIQICDIQKTNIMTNVIIYPLTGIIQMEK